MQAFDLCADLTPGFINNPTAWAILILVMIVFFGGKNIPEMMKGLGQGIRELKRGMESDEQAEPSEEADWKRRRRLEIEHEVRARMEAERQNRRDPSDSHNRAP